MKNWFFIFLLSCFSSQLHALNTIKDANIEQGKLILYFSKPMDSAQVRHFALKGKNSIRYVFDFGDTMIRKRSLAQKLSYSSVRLFRISQFNSTTVRVVLDVVSSYAVSHRPTTPYRYQISLPSEKKRKVGTPSDLFASIEVAQKKYSKKVQKTKQTTKKRREAKSKKSFVKKPKRRYTIVIDPGHGGKDSGATAGRGYTEKRVVLAISKKVRKHLQRLGFKVYMTRTSDRFVRLRDRTKYANKKHADAFISIHANAAGGHTIKIAKGLESYYLQVSRSARSKRVAVKENSVVLRAKDLMSKSVILNLMTGPKIIMSNKMAIDIQKGMLKNTRSRFRGVSDHGVRGGPFWVLVGAQMPAALIEVGYITHPVEKKRLVSSSYQNLLAKGIAEGISNYFANREREME